MVAVSFAIVFQGVTMMKISSVLYLLMEGIKNVARNWMMSLASVCILVLCLSLTGFAVLFSLNIRHTLAEIEGQNTFTVFLVRGTQDSEVQTIGDQIRDMDNIAECNFVSRDEAIRKLGDKLGPLLNNLEGENNPLPHSFYVTMKDLSKYTETKNELEALSGVEKLNERSLVVVEKLMQLDNFIFWAGICVMIIFVSISLFIVSNTIRLTMYSRRFEISIMKSVGATNSFVRLPFLVEGVTIGIISAITSASTLFFLFDLIINRIKENPLFMRFTLINISPTMFFAFILAGVLFGLAGGFISIRKYLKKEGGEVIGW